MICCVDREVVLPGVGVYHPRTQRLEGAADRIKHLNINQDVDRLTIHVHKPEDLPETLSSPKMAKVRACSINYINSFHFPGLKRALDVARFDRETLQFLKVAGATIVPRQMKTLRSLHSCIGGAKVLVGDMVSRPTHYDHDEVIHAGDEWFRHYGSTIALYATSLPDFENEIRDRQVDSLEIDCDEQFHVPALGALTDGSLSLTRLTLHNVATTSIYFLDFLNRLNVRGLRAFEITTGCQEVQACEKTMKVYFKTKPNLRGVALV